MAITHLKDVTVTGTFSKGFRVTESSKSKDGREYTQRWTIWSDGLGVHEGDVVSLSGFLSARVNDWTDKDGQARHSVELGINFPRMVTDAEQRPEADSWAASTPAAEPWNADASVPF